MTHTALLLVLALALALGGLTACNTMRGVGEDVSTLGDRISGTAERAERRMQQ